MNKKYLVSLNEDKTEKLKVWLTGKGLTLSQYLDSMVCEAQEVAENFKIPADVSKMTIGQFSRLASRMLIHLRRK